MQSQVLPIAIFALFPLVFVGFWGVVCFLLAFVGGWRRLALSYGTDKPPHGNSFRWQSGMIGFVQYRNCLNISVADDGLYLSVVVFFRLGHKPLFVPWTEIDDVQARQILWYSFTRFRVGTPSVATVQIPTKVFEADRRAN